MYVEDVNDEVPVFTQRQYNRVGLRETAGIGTSVAVVRATDRDTGEEVVLSCKMQPPLYFYSEISPSVSCVLWAYLHLPFPHKNAVGTDCTVPLIQGPFIVDHVAQSFGN